MLVSYTGLARLPAGPCWHHMTWCLHAAEPLLLCQDTLMWLADGPSAFAQPTQEKTLVACQALKQSCVAADDVITPEDVFDLMEEDLKVADLILWVGISFEQSASIAYFRRVSI